jgi:tripartite-type tricarboxylate transporter receptor subunit TctC
MIIGYSAGGGTDVLARALQRPLAKELGTTIVIENIPAGATKVATLELLKSKPDGYTLTIHSGEGYDAYYYSGTYDYKPTEKLSIVGSITREPYGFMEVRADSGFQAWQDVVKYAKANPGKLNCGGSTAGGMMNLLFVEAAKAAGIEAQFVPFAGAGPAKNALLGGHVDMQVCQPSESIVMIRAGKTRGLAVSSAERLQELPNVPTFKELGIGDAVNIHRAIFGPPNMPPEVVKAIGLALQKAIQDPEFVQFCQRMFFEPYFWEGSGMKDYFNTFNEKYGPKLMAMNKS